MPDVVTRAHACAMGGRLATESGERVDPSLPRGAVAARNRGAAGTPLGADRCSEEHDRPRHVETDVCSPRSFFKTAPASRSLPSSSRQAPTRRSIARSRRAIGGAEPGRDGGACSSPRTSAGRARGVPSHRYGSHRYRDALRGAHPCGCDAVDVQNAFTAMSRPAGAPCEPRGPRAGESAGGGDPETAFGRRPPREEATEVTEPRTR